MNFSQALTLAREHTSIVERMEFALRKDPENRRLALGLGSARRRAARSEELLRAFAAASQIDLIRYRLERSSDFYAVEAVSDSVHSFQKSFTGAADFLEHGPKAKARYSTHIEHKTRLNFAYTFPGSLGIVMAIENDQDMFEGGDFDRVVDVFSQFLSVDSETAAIDASRSLGGALITQLCRWVDVNAKWESAVDFVVRRPNGVLRGEFVSRNRFYDLADIFHAAVDEEPSDVEVSGLLVGLDIDLGTFHFVVPNGPDYRGVLGEEFAKEKTTVGERYTAKIYEKVSRVVATGKETRTFKLEGLVKVRD